METLLSLRTTRLVQWVLVVSILVPSLGPLPAWSQTVSGVRGLGGGVGALFSLVGPGSLYIDTQGTQGYIYPQGTFETFNFRNPMTGQFWAGGIMTLGPQLTVGLIQGANQVGTPVVIPSPPRQTVPPPEVESTLLEIP
jgi:hypothetical protein